MRHDELLKTTEVAKLLCVHPKQVYRLIEQGLPGRRVGSEWRFVRDEVLGWSSTRGEPSSVSPPIAPMSGAATPPLLGARGQADVARMLDLERSARSETR
jgi:excisionase family DNA binding protein